MKSMDSTGALLPVDPNEFLEYSCYQDPTVLYTANNKKYFFGGIGWEEETQRNRYWVMVCDSDPEDSSGYIEVFGISWGDAVKKFCEQPFFDGKTFWEAEPDLVWID